MGGGRTRAHDGEQPRTVSAAQPARPTRSTRPDLCFGTKRSLVDASPPSRHRRYRRRARRCGPAGDLRPASARTAGDTVVSVTDERATRLTRWTIHGERVVDDAR